MSDITNVKILGDNNETNLVVDASKCIVTISEQVTAGPPGPPGPIPISERKNISKIQVYYNSGIYDYDFLDIETELKYTLLDNSETSSIKYLLVHNGGSWSEDSKDSIAEIRNLQAKYTELFCIFVQTELTLIEKYEHIIYRENIFKTNRIPSLLIKKNGIHPLSGSEFASNLSLLGFRENITNSDYPGLFLFDLREHKYFKKNSSLILSLNDVEEFMEDEVNINRSIVQNQFNISTVYKGYKPSVVNILPYNNFINPNIKNLSNNIIEQINKKISIRIDEHLDNFGSLVIESQEDIRLTIFKDTLVKKINDLGYFNTININSLNVISDIDIIINVIVTLI